MRRMKRAVALGGVLVAACATAKLEVPPELSTAERLPVSGRLGWTATQSVRFGGWRADSVDRAWTRGRDVRINAYSRETRQQGYAFTMRGPADAPAWRVECEAVVRVRGANVRGITVEAENRSSLDCELRPEAGPRSETWRLELDESGEKPLTGRLVMGESSFDVIGTNRVEGGALPAMVTTGYRIDRDGRARAAVEAMNDGAVWLNAADTREASLLAATAAALLLLEDLRASLPQN